MAFCGIIRTFFGWHYGIRLSSSKWHSQNIGVFRYCNFQLEAPPASASSAGVCPWNFHEISMCANRGCWIVECSCVWKPLRFGKICSNIHRNMYQYLRNPLHCQTSFGFSSLAACSCNRCLQTGVQALKFRSARKSPLSTSAGCTHRLSLIAKTSALWNAMRFLQVAPYHASGVAKPTLKPPYVSLCACHAKTLPIGCPCNLWSSCDRLISLAYSAKSLAQTQHKFRLAVASIVRMRIRWSATFKRWEIHTLRMFQACSAQWQYSGQTKWSMILW